MRITYRSRHSLEAGFEVELVLPVVNMPFLYHLSLLRDRSHRIFDEGSARAEGYRLSTPARVLQKILSFLFPNQYCNIFVVMARKP